VLLHVAVFVEQLAGSDGCIYDRNLINIANDVLKKAGAKNRVEKFSVPDLEPEEDFEPSGVVSAQNVNAETEPPFQNSDGSWSLVSNSRERYGTREAAEAAQATAYHEDFGRNLADDQAERDRTGEGPYEPNQPPPASFAPFCCSPLIHTTRPMPFSAAYRMIRRSMSVA
jgi:hypothetical protein